MASEEFLIGKRERLNWVQETSYGSGGSLGSGEIVGLNAVLTPAFSQSWEEVLTAGADNRQVQDRVLGPKALPFTMNFAPVNWRWLKYMMDVADADDAGTKTHTFTLGNTVETFKLEWARRHSTNHVLTLIGGVVTRAELSWTKPTGEGAQSFLNVALDCYAQDDSQGSSVASVSNITKEPFQFRSVTLTLDNTEITEVNSGNMIIENNIDPNDSRYANNTQDRLVGDPIPKVFRVSGTFNINVKDKTYYDLWNTEDVISNCSLVFTRGGANDNMTFTFSNLRVENPEGDTNLEGVNNVNLAFTAEGFTSVVARDDITTY